MALYAIKTPKGKILDETVATGYPWAEFWYSRNKFLSRSEAEALIRKSKKAGYKKVRVWLTEEKPK